MRVRAILSMTLMLGAVVTFACGSSGDDSSNDNGPGGTIQNPRPDLLKSTLEVDRTTATGDGTAVVKITLTLRAGNGQVVPSFPVALEASGTGNKFSAAGGNTNEQGIFSATLASTTAEAKTVKATFGGMELSTLLTFDACRGPMFGPATKVAVGPFPAVSAVGDFNRDGKADLAVIDRQDMKVGIVLGKGDGTFSSPTSYPVGNYPYSITTADFNRDDKLDIAVANANSKNVSLLLGAGDGTFTAASNIDLTEYPSFITTGDFDRDGKTDFVTQGETSGSLQVLIGNGNGTFLAPKTFGVATGGRIYSLGVGDFNRDNISDLVVGGAVGKGLNLLLGKGDGTFAASTEHDGASGSLAVGDFTGDTVPDVVASSFDTMMISRGNGDGTLSRIGQYTTGKPYVQWTAAGDLNGDGKLDVIVANNADANVGVLLGKGDGTFGELTKFATDPSPYFVTTGDFDGDGKLDLVVNNYDASNKSTQVLLNTGCRP